MLELITDIIDAEKKAEEIVSEAKQDVSKRKQENEEALQKKLGEAREDAREKANTRIAEAREKAEKQKSDARSAGGMNLDAFVTDNHEAIETVIDGIVDLVTTPEYSRE